VNEPETRDQRYEDAMRHYRELAQGVRMIREAVEQTFGAGLLPAGKHAAVTPFEECEAIARAIYAAGSLQGKEGPNG